MYSLKVIGIAILMGVAILSCDAVSQHFVTKEEFEASESENRELKSSLEAIQRNYAKQNKELNAILSEISSISCQTSKLQLNLESPIVNQTQTEMIHDNIENLKRRIDNLEKEAARSRKIDKNYALASSTIKELRETIINKEREIQFLETKISEHEVIINNQKDTIEQQYSEILHQKEELKKTVELQTKSLFQAGLKFAEIADEGDFKIHGRRNKQSVAGYRKSIYNEAIKYLEESKAQGHKSAADSIFAIKKRMESIE